MNIIKNKKIIAITLTFVLVMTLVGLPLSAKERRGATIEVILIDWHRIKGELLAVKGHELIIHDKSRDQGFTVNIERVSRIWLSKKPRFFSGLAKGLLVGVGLGVILYASTNKRDDFRELALIVPSMATIPIGGLLGALQGLPVKLPIKGEEPTYVEECLQYLHQYARY